MRLPAIAALPAAVLLLSPLAAPAQTPASAKIMLKRVSIQVTFVAVNTDDLDALGIDFNARLLTGETYLRCAEGSIVLQSYQRLTQIARVNDHVVTLAPVEVADNVPTVIRVNTHQVHGEITLIPQIMSETLVELNMLSPLDANQKVLLYCSPSGQQTVIDSAVLKMQPMVGCDRIKGISGHSKVSHAIELLIFVTPTIVSTDAANNGSVSIKS